MRAFCLFLVGLAAVTEALALEFEWATLSGVGYDFSEWDTLDGWRLFTGWSFAATTVGSVAACQEFCEASVGCSFVVYTAASGACEVKLTDQTKWTQTIFAAQTNANYLFGEIRNARALGSLGGVASVGECKVLCVNSLNGACQFARFDTSKNTCELKAFNANGGQSVSFRRNPRAVNDRRSTEGMLVSAGNTGIVSIAAGLLPNGKIILGARPEYQRGSANWDNILAGSPTGTGEIAALYDPTTETHVPVRVTDNIFCHGQVLTEDGDMFTAGGDASAYDGLTSGLDRQRLYVTATNTYLSGKSMQRTRWYNTVVRTAVDTIWMIGGQANGDSYSLNPNMDIYTPGVEGSPNKLVNVDLIQRTGITNYAKSVIVPGSGHVFLFVQNEWSILDKNSGAELERNQWLNGDTSSGFRGGDYVCASAILPMFAAATAAGHVCEFILFGGGSSNYYSDPGAPETTIASVQRVKITAPTKTFTYDEPMPYGRVVSDALVQPNGKILLFNGGRHGRSGGDIGRPLLYGAASEIFCFDPTKPYGSRWQVFAKSPNRRFYHSTVVLLPDATSIIMGTDEATYDKATAYDHEAERFTPPWLLDGSPRPVITSSPSGTVYYGTDFVLTYSGADVDRVTLMAPNSNTHGTEMSQRTLFLQIVCNTGTQITVRAPVDVTVMIKGHYMLFAVAGDTPSKAVWVKLGSAPAGFVFQALLPLDGSACLPSSPVPAPVPRPSAAPVVAPTVPLPPCFTGNLEVKVQSAGYVDGNAAVIEVLYFGVSTGFDSRSAWVGRGFNVVALLPPERAVTTMQVFDIYAGAAQATAMLATLSALPVDSLVAIAAKDALDFYNPGASNLSPELKAFMATAFGATKFAGLAFRDSYAFLGFKGAASPVSEVHHVSGAGLALASSGALGCPVPPSHAPSPKPTLRPTVHSTGHPTAQPTSKPTAHPTSLPTGHPASQPITAPAIFMVSASACDDLGWPNAATYGSSSVCGESDLNLGGCSNAISWPQAKDFCESSGARLCSVAELQKNEAKGTGCGYDSALVWSRDTCVGGFTVAYGATLGGSSTACKSLTEAAEVRCCADITGVGSPLSPTSQPVLAPTKPPTAPVSSPAVLVSSSSCEEMGWGNAARYGSSSVCGESDLGLGGCSGILSWPLARDFCELNGARMCSVEELSQDEAKSTGCGLDKVQLWTRTACDGGYLVAFGASFAGSLTKCTKYGSEVYPIRCCADVRGVVLVQQPSINPVPAPTKFPTGGIPIHQPTKAPSPSPWVSLVSTKSCNDLGWPNAATYGSSSVCGESDLNLGGCSNAISWPQAKNFCESSGARLCSVDEMQMNEARATGCGYDKTFLWTRDTCVGGFTVAYGSTFGGSNSACKSSTEATPVRCCADVPVVGASPTKVPVQSPTPSPAAAASVSTCDDLGWTNAEKFGSSAVCGESDLGLGGCSGLVEWQDAKHFCEVAGARLCSVAELLANEARGTGCGSDNSLVWSGDPCGSIGGHAAAFGATTGGSTMQCLAPTSIPLATKARCCADVGPPAVPAATSHLRGVKK